MGATLVSAGLTNHVQQLFQQGIDQLRGVSRTPRLDVELLLAHTLGWSRAKLIAAANATCSDAQAARFSALLARRLTGEPIAYLTGEREFYGLTLAVDRRVLVPRPETELLVELALTIAATPHELPVATLLLHAPPATTSGAGLVIADIGTGSGAIALALAYHLPAARIYATDLSPAALAVAQANAARHHLSERITFLAGDLLAPLPEPVDLLVSNPPYTVLSTIEPHVYAHEPHLALDGGPDGLAPYRTLAATAQPYLRPGGAILLEIGATQAGEVQRLFAGQFTRIAVYQDLAGLERVVVGCP